MALKDLAAGIALLLVLAMPAALYMIINMLDWPSIHLGLLTIPRFPSVSRITTEVALLQPAPLQHFLQNAAGFFGMIITQSQGPANSTSSGYPYGYLYLFTFPLILAGAVVFSRSTKDALPRRLLLAWLVPTAVLGLLISPTFGHNNVLILALILLCAASLEFLMTWNKAVFVLSLAVFLTAFALFTGYFHGTEYREVAQREYYEGLLPALDYACSSTSGPICVDNTKIIQPEIFVMFSEKADASVAPDKVVYADFELTVPAGQVCWKILLRVRELPAGRRGQLRPDLQRAAPVPGRNFTTRMFEGFFKVLVPR